MSVRNYPTVSESVWYNPEVSFILHVTIRSVPWLQTVILSWAVNSRRAFGKLFKVEWILHRYDLANRCLLTLTVWVHPLNKREGLVAFDFGVDASSMWQAMLVVKPLALNSCVTSKLWSWILVWLRRAFGVRFINWDKHHISVSILHLYLHTLSSILCFPFLFFFEVDSCLFMDEHLFGLNHFEKEHHRHPCRSRCGWTFATEAVRAGLCCVRQS